MGVPKPVIIFILLAKKEDNNLLMRVTYLFISNIYYVASITPCAEKIIIN